MTESDVTAQVAPTPRTQPTDRPTMHWTTISDGQGGSFLHAVWAMPGGIELGGHTHVHAA